MTIMPPKKQRKLVEVGLTDKPTGQKKRASKNAKTSVASKSKNSRRKRKGSVDSSVFTEAALGAGVRSTEELQNYMRQTRSRSQSVEEGNQTVQPSTSAEPLSDGELSSAGSKSDGGESTSSSDSESSDSELGEVQVGQNDPVRRKIPFNKETRQITPTPVSPGSLENGQDVRNLGKLQEMLVSNPQAVTAITSMLDVIKAMQADQQMVEQGNATAEASNGNSTLPPPPGQRNNRPGMSETTIYTHAVPSASPSQEAQRDQDLRLDRLVLSGAAQQFTAEGNLVDPSAILLLTKLTRMLFLL